MSCRESRLSSALVTFARSASGLNDQQVLSLNHALMREGAAQAAGEQDWVDAIDTIQHRWEAGELARGIRSRNPLARLEAARAENPDGARLYAASRLVERATTAAAEHQAYLTDLARDAGVPYATIQQRFEEAYAAIESRGTGPSETFLATLRGTDRGTRLPTDRRTLAAYEQLAGDASARIAAAPQRPTVTRRQVQSSAVAEMGYDPESGRVEVVMRSNPERVYAYRMSPDEWREFDGALSVGSYFARNVRANPRFQYDTGREQAADGTRGQCPTCGQFRGAGAHTCPVPGSPAAVSADLSTAVAAATGAPARREPAVVIYQGRRTPYRFGNLVARMPGVTRVQQDARLHGRVEVPVRGIAQNDGASYWDRLNLSGHVIVNYDPRTRRYSAEHADDIDHRLRCECAAYQQTRDCIHVQNYLAGVNALISRGSATREERIAAAAAAQAAMENQAGRTQRAADAAAATYASTFAGLTSSHAADDTVFQETYEEMRAARTEYRAALARGESPTLPLPYIRENAFGGLAAPGGRGFGIELEFGFDRNMSGAQIDGARAAIGRELYAAGLTPDSRQRGYGASHGAYRDQHQGGWSFEQDFSTGGSDGLAGGELVSPVMWDTPETWTNIEKVCDIITRNGGKVTLGSGMHVHVGVGDYGTRVENHNRLLNAFASNEDLIYRLASDPARGTHRGSGYCSPNRQTSTPFTDVSGVRREHTGHNLGINFQSVSGRRGDHVEFRAWDATLKPAAIQAHIGMSVMMAAAATREGVLSTRPAEGHSPLGSRLAANPNRAALSGDEWKASTLPMRQFLDRFVPGNGGPDGENPLFRQLVGMFAFSKPQRGRR
jgi:hypothetical protein